MKSYFFSFSFFLVLIYLVKSHSPKAENPEDILQSITNNFHNQLNYIGSEIVDYLQTANALKADQSSIKNLQTAHLNTRLAYKQTELFLEYFDREGVKKYINGAPLPKVEPHVPEVRIIEPSGLQTLDELVFSKNPFSEKENIIKLVSSLQKKFDQMQAYQKGIQFQHRYIFEASRQELVRIFTLGVSGFDTPLSGNAIPEALQSIASINQNLSYYFPIIRKESPELQKKIADQLTKTMEYLQNQPGF